MNFTCPNKWQSSWESNQSFWWPPRDFIIKQAGTLFFFQSKMKCPPSNKCRFHTRKSNFTKKFALKLARFYQMQNLRLRPKRHTRNQPQSNILVPWAKYMGISFSLAQWQRTSQNYMFIQVILTLENADQKHNIAFSTYTHQYLEGRCLQSLPSEKSLN